MPAVKNKDVAMGDLGYERIEADFYATEAIWTKKLVPFIPLFNRDNSIIWECAAGEGDILDVLTSAGHRVFASDLHDRGRIGIDAGVDFLEIEHLSSDINCIITNPPYSKGEEFIRHAIELVRPARGSVAMFMRNEYDTTKGRLPLFNDPELGFAMKIVTAGRPRWIKGSKGGPRHTYAWYVWDHRHTGPSQIHHV